MKSSQSWGGFVDVHVTDKKETALSSITKEYGF
jgi:hypothetical protein